jgi:hypothetical protein
MKTLNELYSIIQIMKMGWQIKYPMFSRIIYDIFIFHIHKLLKVIHTDSCHFNYLKIKLSEASKQHPAGKKEDPHPYTINTL